MNIVGKILVLLNLVFAVATGGFLVVDFATRTNWKRYAEGLERELAIAEASSNAAAQTRIELDRQAKKAKSEIETVRQSLKDKETELKAQILIVEHKVTEEELKAKDADATAQSALAEATRLKAEAKDLLATIQKREKDLLDIQAKNKDLRDFAAGKERLWQITQDRNEKLLKDIEELMQKNLASEKTTDKLGPFDPNALNPPPVNVKGVIEKVIAKDPGLVEISIGSDQGLKMYHTLEVFRLNGKSEYLGTIRIMDVGHHRSVGRLMRSSYVVSRGPLREGDRVATKLGN